MELIETEIELIYYVDHGFRHHRGAVRVEEQIQGSADAIVVEPAYLIRLDTDEIRPERRTPAGYRINRPPIQDDVPEKDAETCGGVRVRRPVVVDVATDNGLDSGSFEEVVYDRQGANSLGSELERSLGCHRYVMDRRVY